jgi:hypothetical protein
MPEDTIAWLLRDAGAVKPISHDVTCTIASSRQAQGLSEWSRKVIFGHSTKTNVSDGQRL